MGSCIDFSSLSEAMEAMGIKHDFSSESVVMDPFDYPSESELSTDSSPSTPLWIFWTHNSENNSVQDRIRKVLISFSEIPEVYYSIVQFWAVKREAVNKCILTSSHQPFGIRGLKKSHYVYQKECMIRNINVGPEADEGQLGPVGRAFRNVAIEFSPEIMHYTIQEFPLRDHAILGGLETLVSLPVFELDSDNIVGVLEFLSESDLSNWTDDLVEELMEVGLTINFIGLSGSKAIVSGVHAAAGGETNFFVPQENLSGGIEEIPPVHQGENNCVAASGIEATPLVHQVENISSIAVGTRPVAEGEKKCGKRPSWSQMKAKKINISFDELKLQMGNVLDVAAENVGVSKAKFKGICRSYGIHRWPSQRKNKVNPSLFTNQNLNDTLHIGSSEANSTYHVMSMQSCIRSSHVNQTDQHQAVSYRDSEVNKIVTIMASYGDRVLIRFELNGRSTLQDLKEEIIKRLQLEANRIQIRYLDEDNDWITIIIEEDLRYCLKSSINRGESTISMSIKLRVD